MIYDSFHSRPSSGYGRNNSLFLNHHQERSFFISLVYLWEGRRTLLTPDWTLFTTIRCNNKADLYRVIFLIYLVFRINQFGVLFMFHIVILHLKHVWKKKEVGYMYVILVASHHYLAMRPLWSLIVLRPCYSLPRARNSTNAYNTSSQVHGP